MNKVMTPLTVCATLTLALLCFDTTSFAQEKFALCKPVETFSFPGRVHVRCETPVDGVFVFFACSTQDAHFASRMLNLSMAAQVSQKTLSILFDPNDMSGVAFGCLAKDCRNLHGIGMTEASAPIVATHDANECPGLKTRIAELNVEITKLKSQMDTIDGRKLAAVKAQLQNALNARATAQARSDLLKCP